MNRIVEQFKKQSKLFIPFITAGDPSPDATVDIALALEEAGADMIELGVPYSDPLADGPTIQRASARALAHGITIVDVIALAGRMRQKGIVIPLILFTYYNPILQYGLEKTLQLMDENGMNGLIVPDLPVEESGELKALSSKYNKALISLVAPTSASRIEKIASQAEGFVYCVSSLGVTGVRDRLSEGIEEFIKCVKTYTRVPVAVGFGISKREQVETLAPYCDGIIVGSALVSLIEEEAQNLMDQRKRTESLHKIKMFVKDLRSGVI